MTPSARHRTRLGTSSIGMPHTLDSAARGVSTFGPHLANATPAFRRPLSQVSNASANASGRLGTGYGLSAGMKKGTPQGAEYGPGYR